MKTILVFTSARSDYGILSPLIKKLDNDQNINLKLIACSAHLAPEHGLSIKDIQNDGFQIDASIESLISGNSFKSVSASVGLLIVQLTEQLSQFKPDLVVLLGDRYETFACAAACASLRIPVAHIHGGEITLGAIDELYRHAITKMSHLHFTSTLEYRNRIVQMGEDPEKTHYVGSMGVENALALSFLSREETFALFDFDPTKQLALICYHPETTDTRSTHTQRIEIIVKALDAYPELQLMITYPNADPGHHEIVQFLENYVKNRPNAKIYPNLGHFKYLNFLNEADMIIGNSSSGIIEANALKTPCIDIGARQNRRAKDLSVLWCDYNINDIQKNIKQALDKDFLNKVFNTESIYQGPSVPSQMIHTILCNTQTNTLFVKNFNDL